LIAFLGFRRACDAQGVTRADRPFNSHFQPFTAYAALVFFIIIIVFNGWKVFTHDAVTGASNWSIQDFVTAYVVIPIYLGLFLFWKLYKKTKFVKASEADLWTGKAALDAEVWPEQVPRNFLEKIWFWIA